MFSHSASTDVNIPPQAINTNTDYFSNAHTILTHIIGLLTDCYYRLLSLIIDYCGFDHNKIHFELYRI